MFGYMVITYSNEVASTEFKGKSSEFRYRVVDSGDDYVVIRARGGALDGWKYRIDFTPDRAGYWIDFGLFGIREKFDRVIPGQPVP